MIVLSEELNSIVLNCAIFVTKNGSKPAVDQTEIFLCKATCRSSINVQQPLFQLPSAVSLKHSQNEIALLKTHKRTIKRDTLNDHFSTQKRFSIVRECGELNASVIDWRVDS